MRTIWLSLAWKELHEHKWKFASLLATLWSATTMMILGMQRDVPPRDVLTAVRVVLVMCIVPLAIFIGLGAAAGERSRGTLPFLQALPVPTWRVALNKVFFGIATIVGAALLTLAFIYIWSRVRGFDRVAYRVDLHSELEPFSFGVSNWFGDTALAMLCVAISFYIWTIACGANRRDEVSAGAVALVIMVFWSASTIYAVHWLIDVRQATFGLSRGSWMRLAAIAVSTIPGGIVKTIQIGMSTNQSAKDLLLFGIIAAAVSHIALATWYVRRFGRITNLEVRSPRNVKRTADQSDWLGPPRSSVFIAVAWKQIRESGPIVVAGLAGIIGIVAITQMTEWFESGRRTHVGETYNAVAIVLGFVMALVIGIGVCFYDVQPRLNSFWRSRPINPDLWFWCKFVTGMVVLLIAIYAPILLIAAFGDRSALAEFDHRESYLLPIAHIAVFASAVAMTCLVRQAIYAAILSIAFLYLGILLVYGAWYVTAFIGWTGPDPSIGWEPTLMQTATALLTSFVISTLIAWLAMRYDWGRKSRY